MDLNMLKCTVGALVTSGNLTLTSDIENHVFERIKNLEFPLEKYLEFKDHIKFIGVTDEFYTIIKLFQIREGELPAGFRPEFVYGTDCSIRVNLARDISYASNGVKRPTSVLFSANSANPFQVREMKNLIANLTTNPQIIYDQFLNNPKANVNNQFKDRFEVLEELCRIVGPGVDISVEVNNPFAEESMLMEEIAQFEEILTPYRLVVKVPHTGPLNANNVQDFLNGTYSAYDEGDTINFFTGHNLAYRLSQKGYRVNFTLMFDPHQTALALLARPYFINAFVERRHQQSLGMRSLLEKLDTTGEAHHREQLHEFMFKTDLLASGDQDHASAEEKARKLIKYRGLDSAEGHDGLDTVRHSLRVLRQSNLPDTRLILCNMKSPEVYQDIDKLLVTSEFADMAHRVIITCEPEYFAQFTSAPGIYSYQRSFLNSVK